MDAQTIVAVDDLYRPYRPKRRTRATDAKEKGLEPLANIIMLQITKNQITKEAEVFVNPEKGVENVEQAIQGAKDIIAEMISDNAEYRNAIRKLVLKQGMMLQRQKIKKKRRFMIITMNIVNQ